MVFKKNNGLLQQKMNNKGLALGRLLSKIINSTHRKPEEDIIQGMECPSADDISSFIDGTLSKEEHQKIISHLNRCNDCYLLCSETLKTIEDVEGINVWEVKVKTAPWKKIIPIAIAASLAFLIICVYTFYKISSSRTNAPFFSNRASVIAQKIKSESHLPYLLGFIGGGGNLYGFSGRTLSINQMLFWIGVYQADLEVALTLEDKERALDLIRAINHNLSTKELRENAREIISLYNDLMEDIEEGCSMKRLAGVIDRALTKDRNKLLLVRLGQWTRLGGISASLENRDFFQEDEVGFFIDKLKDKGLQRGVLNSLRSIEDIVKKDALSNRDYTSLKGEFDNIILLM